MFKSVTDPLGNQVIIPQSILDATDKMLQGGEVMDDIQKMIEKPAMLFKKKEGCLQLFYLRAIGWNTTVLLEVHQTHLGLEVLNYQLNPDMEHMRDLHLRCERLI